MKAQYQLTERMFLRRCGALRRHDRGRFLDFVSAAIAVLGLAVGAFGYYLFGPNLISHATVAFFGYWFLLRPLVLRAVRKAAFHRQISAGKNLQYEFTEDAVNESEGEGQPRTVPYSAVKRAVADRDGLLLDCGANKIWVPREAIPDSEREKLYSLLEKKLTAFSVG